MRLPPWTDHLDDDLRLHLGNVADNLQLVADLGFSDVALAVATGAGELRVVADARPSNAAYPFPAPRTGIALTPEDEPEAHAALVSGELVNGSRRRVVRDVSYRTEAYPIGAPQPAAVVLRVVGEPVEADPGRMERVFIRSARDLLDALRCGPLRDTRTGELFATTRRAGDGVLRVDARGRVTYASPNAVTIMRLAGVESRVTGMRAAELPGGAPGIAPVLGAHGALAIELEVAERVLSYRSVALRAEALVLVEDLTEARRREREIGVKEATIREVHHRVKNNLQTIASLFRIQARRSDNPEVHRALAEATERAAAMAAVHDLLSRSEHESVDFGEAAGRIVNLVRDGVAGGDTGISVTMQGSSGQVDAKTATPLALVLAELVHNALEHAFEEAAQGSVRVTLLRDVATLRLTVEDDGRGLPAGFDLRSSTGLGFSIIRTLVEEDLRGAMEVTGDDGTRVAITVPLRAQVTPPDTSLAAKDDT
jgi:two-component system, sensor histidine kinase PdtaS